jgi:hypothetical protein
MAKKKNNSEVEINTDESEQATEFVLKEINSNADLEPGTGRFPEVTPSPFQVMNELLENVWQQYWKVREVTNHSDPFQKKRALEFEQNYRDAKRAIFDLEYAKK